MAWSTPSTRSPGYTVTAANWNEIVNNLIYLKTPEDLTIQSDAPFIHLDDTDSTDAADYWRIAMATDDLAVRFWDDSGSAYTDYMKFFGGSGLVAIQQTLQTESLQPSADDTKDLGAAGANYRRVYAKRIYDSGDATVFEMLAATDVHLYDRGLVPHTDNDSDHYLGDASYRWYKVHTMGIEIDGTLDHDGSNLGVFGTAPTTQQTVSGTRDNPESALANLLTALAAYGLIVDSTTAS